jgi:hypothetical protein
MARIVATLNDCNTVSSSLAPAARTRWSEDFIGIKGTSNVRLPPNEKENVEEQRRLDGDGNLEEIPVKLGKLPVRVNASQNCQMVVY